METNIYSTLPLYFVLLNDKKCWLVGIFFLYYIIFGMAAQIPVHHGRPIEKDDNGIWEVRMVILDNKDLFLPNTNKLKCQIPRNRDLSHYYITKRVADISEDPNQFIASYQFIASADESFTQLQDKPNEVFNEYGSVFCEMSVIGKVRMAKWRKRKAKNCGIQQLLYSLCFIDKDVNRFSPASGMNPNFNRIFKNRNILDDKYGLDTLNMIKKSCDKFVGVRMSTNRIELNGNIAYAKGAQKADYCFAMVRSNEKRCRREPWLWRIFEFGDLTRDYGNKQTIYEQFYMNDYWYFCQAYT